MIIEILKELKKEKDRVNAKFISRSYSTNSYRERCAELGECIDIVLEVAKKEYTDDEINKLINEYLMD